MKLYDVKPVFETTYTREERELLESAVDFLGSLKAQVNYGKLNPADNVTKNKIALFVGLLAKVKQYKDGKIGQEELMKILRGVTARGDESNEELDVMHDMSNDPAAVKLRDEIIMSLTPPGPETKPEAEMARREKKQRFLKTLDNMQNSFYKKLQSPSKTVNKPVSGGIKRTF